MGGQSSERKIVLLRLAQLVINPNGGGAERVASSNHLSFKESKIDSHLIALEPSLNQKEFTDCRILTSGRGSLILKLLKAALKLNRLIESMQITHIHAHCEPCELVLSLAVLNRKNIKIFVTEHIDHPWENHRILGMITRYYLLKRNTTFVGCREFVHLRKYDANIKSIPNPLRMQYSQAQVQSQSFTNLKRVFLPQRLIARKNLEMIFQAVHDLNLDVPIVVVGDGEHKLNLENMAKNLGIKASFVGFQRNPWVLFEDGDLVISASLYEGEPMAIIEAIALNAPILLSNIDGHRFAVSQEKQLFASQNELKETLSQLQKGEINLSHLRSTSDFRHSFLEIRSQEYVAAKWLDLYLNSI